MSDEQQFPIHPEDQRMIEGCPATIPWAVLEPYRKRAWSNHSQSLERLAERGGLGLIEIYAIMHDTDYYDLRKAGELPSAHEALLFVRSVQQGT